MAFRLTGILTLLKRHGRNLSLKRNLETKYDTSTSTTYKTLNDYQDFDATVVEISPGLGVWYYIDDPQNPLGSINRQFYEKSTLLGLYINTNPLGELGVTFVFPTGIDLGSFPRSLKINGQVTNFVSLTQEPGGQSIFYEPIELTDGNVKIEINEQIATVRGYFYDSRNLSEYATQIEEGNRRVVLYPYDTTGNPIPKPEISDTVEGQRDTVSIWRVEEVMSNEKVLAYICRVKE